MRRTAVLTTFALAAATTAQAQQVADTSFRPAVGRPLAAPGSGPVVAIDEGHHNFHTVDGRYRPFAELLRRDGYVVRAHAGAFTAASLAGIRVLVIANALHARNAGGGLAHWDLPNPSAFSPEEIAAVRAWVEGGGSLLLIADHMPFGGAAQELGAAFGLRWINGFADDTARAGILAFRRADGALRDHAVTRGRDATERVDSVISFTGSAFEGPQAEPLMVFPAGAVSYNPRVAWQFDSTTVREPVGGLLQGAVLRVGRGRVAAFGEAAMFSAQVAGPQRRPMGMNAPYAPQNPRFLLNVMHWLSGELQ